MSKSPIRILIVDDERGMREGCRRILEGEGYEVETAEDGLAGLEIFQRDKDFAVALVDLKMPGMNGMELTEKIHALNEDTVVLIITAYATIETAVEAVKRGAYGYVPKPFTPDELLFHVKNAVEKRTLALEAKRLREDREMRLLEVAYERSKSNTIINCMTDGVLVVNREGQVVLRNPAAARILPGLAELPLPAPLDAAVRIPELKSMLAESAASATTPSITSKELPIGECTYMVNTSPVTNPDGTTVGAVGVLRDITALKKLEVAKNMFVSMVAHEVNRPLGAIESYLNLILSDTIKPDPAKTRQMLERARLRAQELRQMVSELMNLRAIEAGKFTLKRQPLDLAQVVTEVVDSYREKAQEKHIELHLECTPVRALADKGAILSVITNLVDNAIKYTPAGGHVWVRVEQNGIYAKATVRDDGIGMSEEEQQKVFEEFYRAKNRFTANVPGTGLGLSLVKRLVELHQGTISLRSAPGKGSEFIVRIPIVETM